MTFGPDSFDVTGAGEFDLGPLDPVLGPLRENLAPNAWMTVALTLDAAGKPLACVPDRPEEYAEATQALCAHALKTGRFRRHPAVTLDYEQATYQLSVWYHEGRRGEKGEEFQTSENYPLERTRVRFADIELPPADQRLSIADLDYEPMSYPRSALSMDLRANVVVVLGFDAEGRVASCRPFESTNTARMAYETCKAAADSFRLKNAPDARSFVVSIAWNIP
ncbi:hypothetical protein [Erythrobacter colymbi]|uniref:hypothetical protein n=1 Tax=Erythrobacter colymbi TaxID=1161202 RepID=UPI000A38EAED|nr:hypothetical protein [Erythrobacter colymbi]